MMKSDVAICVAFFTFGTMFAQPLRAESFYSTASLVILCEKTDELTKDREIACKTYLHGVVETWMLKDTVSINPEKFESRIGFPYCGTITNVSADEWVRIVRKNLKSTDSKLFASAEVMRILSTNLCN